MNARDTTTNTLTQSEATSFCKENHSQGASSTIKTSSLGLFYQDELVGVISFCSPRTTKMKRTYSLELYRLAFKKNVRIRGGASKLIRNFIKMKNPADFFTYQSMTGEGSGVYEKSGMTFVSQAKKKTFLIHPEKEFEECRWGEKEIFTIGEVSRRGPDFLLGTTLGEVFQEGRRLTNPEIFTKVLCWKEHTVPGDRVYEWRDENKSFYTYKIISPFSDKYYIGVKSIPLPFTEVTERDCLKDGYMGSGGVKFKNWYKKYAGSAEKEILGVFKSKAEAYKNEEELVGSSYKDDPLCLNSTSGGLRVVALPRNFRVETSKKTCPVHGISTHRGDSCLKCVSEKRTRIAECPIHGMTKHQGSSCYKCSTTKSITKDTCKVHGLVSFTNGKCTPCIASKKYLEGDCKKHGVSIFVDGRCQRCQAEERTKVKNCPVHGESKFQGGACYSCIVEKRTKTKYCPIHGETKFTGDSCYKCFISKVERKSDKPTVAEIPRLLREWSKDNTLDPKKVTIGSGKRVWWECENGHKWETRIVDRGGEKGCRECSIDATRKNPIYPNNQKKKANVS